MPVSLPSPVVIAASDEVQYPYVWFTDIHISANNPTEDASVTVQGHPLRYLPDGSPDLCRSVQSGFIIRKLFEASAYNTDMIQTVGAAIATATPAELLGITQYVLFKTLEAQASVTQTPEPTPPPPFIPNLGGI
jgi:hypothetical protein